MFFLPQTSSPLLLVVLLPFSLSFRLPDSNPLLSFHSGVRQVHLYTDNHRRQKFLQVTLDGRVSGGEAQTRFSVLELKSVKPGHVAIVGRASSRFLCMDGGGHLRGQTLFVEADCLFRELLLADGYTRFLSSHHGSLVSLASRHPPDRPVNPFTRFLLLRDSSGEPSATEPPDGRRRLDMDSGDLFGMSLDSVVSPQLSGQ